MKHIQHPINVAQMINLKNKALVKSKDAGKDDYDEDFSDDFDDEKDSKPVK
jgi:hypothetical protein